MKKILFFLSGIYNGGTEIETYNLLSKLDKKKYKLFFSYTDFENSDEKMVNKLKQYAEFININSCFEVDTIIYCTEAIDEISTIENNIKFNKSYFWFHYFWPDQEEFLELVIRQNKVNQVIAVSNTTKNELMNFDFLKDKEGKVDTIYNVVDVENIKNKSQENVEIEKCDGLNILTVSRIAPIKRFDRIDQIAQELENQRIPFKWIIIGKVKEDEYSEYAIEIKKRLLKHKDIVFIGEQENPFKYMKHADYTATLSDRETWSLVITESKIVGTPCVTTDFEAAFEQIEDCKNGLILKRNKEDYKELVEKMINLKDKLKKNLKSFNYDTNEIIKKWDEKL